MRSLVVWCVLLGPFFIGCSSSDTPNKDGAVAQNDGKPPTGDGPVTQADGAVNPTSSFTLAVEEVNTGNETKTYTGTTATHSADFGAVIKNGRLTVTVKDSEVICHAVIDTSATIQLPGTFTTNSGFTDNAFVDLKVNNTYYDMQSSGQLTYATCPKMGQMVTVTITAVRLGTSVGMSIKVVTGTLTVKVVSSDDSLSCK
jgi:hypothetical protein